MLRSLRCLILVAASGAACAGVETQTGELPPRPAGAFPDAPRVTASPLPNQVTIPDSTSLPGQSSLSGQLPSSSSLSGQLPSSSSLSGQLPSSSSLSGQMPKQPALPGKPSLPDAPSMPDRSSLLKAPDTSSVSKLTDRSLLPETAAQTIIPFRVPPDRVPPRGLCTIWYDGVPPERQPAPMTCPRAHRIARSHGGRVIWAASGLAYQDGEVASVPYARVDLHGVPFDRLPPPGSCRVWLDGVPPDRQPQPTRCPEAEREAQRTGARVLYMPSSDVR